MKQELGLDLDPFLNDFRCVNSIMRKSPNKELYLTRAIINFQAYAERQIEEFSDLIASLGNTLLMK